MLVNKGVKCEVSYCVNDDGKLPKLFFLGFGGVNKKKKKKGDIYVATSYYN